MKLSRNDKCWCESGKKYKDCHYESDKLIEKYKSEGYEVPPPHLIKTKKQIEGIRRSAALTTGIFEELDRFVTVGITTDEIDALVYEFTTRHGGIPAPLNYSGYPKSVCTSVNNVICHGIPGSYHLQEGDIVNIDVSTNLDDYYSDASRMYKIGEVSPNAEKLVEVSKECLYRGIEAVKAFDTIDAIGKAIEPYANDNGFSIVRDYGGHGIGLEFHEDPWIAHYAVDSREMIMLPGMTFTVEPMVNEGSYHTKLLKDKWTAVTRDKKLSSQWEHTILVTENGCEIIC